MSLNELLTNVKEMFDNVFNYFLYTDIEKIGNDIAPLILFLAFILGILFIIFLLFYVKQRVEEKLRKGRIEKEKKDLNLRELVHKKKEDLTEDELEILEVLNIPFEDLPLFLGRYMSPIQKRVLALRLTNDVYTPPRHYAPSHYRLKLGTVLILTYLLFIFVRLYK